MQACGDEAQDARLGTLSMALTTTTESGVTYRLRGGKVILSGTTSASIDLDAAYVDVPAIEVTLAAGPYELGLKAGWVLERDAGHGYEAVDARFVSANPQVFTLVEGETSAVALQFQAGADTLTLATGHLVVDLGVAAECEAGQWIARSCGPGFEGRQTAHCVQGAWSEFGPCELSDMSEEPMCAIGEGSTHEDTPSAEEQSEDVAHEDTPSAEEQSEGANHEDTPSAPTGHKEEADEQVESPGSACPDTLTFIQKSTLISLSAVETDENATDFYGYAGAIARGPVADYISPSRTTLMLHQEPSGDHSLVVVHGADQEGNQPGRIGLSITEHQGIRMRAWDGENGDRLNLPQAEFKWEWGSCCTDGMALELHEDTSCITMHFVEGEGIEGFDLVTNSLGETNTLQNPYDPFTLCLPEVCAPDTESEALTEVSIQDGVAPGEGDEAPEEKATSTDEDTAGAPVSEGSVEESGTSAGEDEVHEEVLEIPHRFHLPTPDEAPADEGQVDEAPSADEPAQAEPTDDEPAQAEPTDDEPAQAEPTDDEPAQAEPTDDEPAQAEPTDDEPAQAEPTDDEPAQAEPTDDEPAQAEPTDDEPAQAEPTDDEPAQAEPTDDEPAQAEPTDDEPAQAEPTDDEPAQAEPTDDEPAQAEPTDDEPAQAEPTDDEPAQGEPAQDEPAQGEPADTEVTDEEVIGDVNFEVRGITEMWDFEEVSDGLEVVIEDFEFFESGAEVHRAKSGFVSEDGFLHSDKVTFNSWSASTLTADTEPGEPVADGVQVAGDSSKWKMAFDYYGCPWEGGDAAILATSAPNQTSGYEALQANFTTPVRSAVFNVSLNRFGYLVEVFVEGDIDEPSHSFDIADFETLVIGATAEGEGAPGITAIRLTPKEHGLGGYGVWWWSVWSMSFAM